MSEPTYPSGDGVLQADSAEIASPGAPAENDTEGEDFKGLPNPRDAMIERMAERQDDDRFIETREDAEKFGLVGPDGTHQHSEPAGDPEPDTDGADSRRAMHVEPETPVLPDHIVMDGDVAYLRTKVDGEERLVPLDQVRATIQKGEAADVRLRQAAEERADLERREQVVALAEKKLQDDPQIAPPPTPGVDDQALLEGAKKVIKKLYDGDEGDAAKTLADMMSSVRAAEQATTPTVDPELLATRAAAIATETTRVEAYKKDVKKAWTAFQRDYPDLVDDEVLFAAVDKISDLVSAENPDWSPAQVMSETGERTREKFHLTAPVKEDAPIDPPPSDRLDEKRNLVRQPQPRLETQQVEGEEKPQTNAEIFAEIRRQRGQP